MKTFLSKKTILIFLTLLFLHVAGYSQAQPASSSSKSDAAKGPVLSFDNTVHDFGIIPYNGPGSHIYVITNTGATPLIIYNCIKGCGCTDVEWTKEPILPGMKGMVKATYNTKKIGDFSRGVDVYSNDPNLPKVNLRLKGSVLVLPGGEAPPIVTENKTTSKATNNDKW